MIFMQHGDDIGVVGRVRRSCVLAASGIAAGLVMLALPLTASAAPRVSKVSGTVSVVVGERPSGQVVKYLLRHGNRYYELKFDASERRSLRPNARVVVQGAQQGATIDVTGVQVRAAPPATPVSGVRSVLVMPVFWNSPDAVTPAIADNQIGVVDNAFYRENSYSQLGLVASTTQWLRIPRPPTCDDVATIINSAEAAAQNAGINASIYFHNMIYISSADCTGRGWGQIGGKITVIQGTMNSYRTVHELGHNLGLGHAHSKTCTAGSTTVSLSDTCTIDEYGDFFDAMGYVPPGFSENSPSELSAPQKDALGWLSGRSLTADHGTYTLAPMEDQSASRHAIKVNTPGHTLWLECRQGLGVDAPLASFGGITGGVLVHETEPGASSSLLDMTPTTALGFSDAALPAGRSWTDPSGYTTINVNSVGPQGASVSIGLGPARTVVPDVREESPRIAGSQVSSAGLIPKFTGATTARTSYVATETPAPGTIVARGSTVTMFLKPGPVP
jgi:hypothetical protein